MAVNLGVNLDLLRQGDVNAVSNAHLALLNQGYSFVGWHGTSAATIDSMVPDRFDPARAGSGMGLARGRGFYVARNYGLSDDAADSITQDEEGVPDLNGHYPRYPDRRGIPVVLRIYAKYFRHMVVGHHYSWGVQNRAGDPNGDLGVRNTDLTTGLPGNMRDMEIVFRVIAYPNLVAIPSLGYEQDRVHMGPQSVRPAAWGNHDDFPIASNRREQYALGVSRRPMRRRNSVSL